MSAAQKEVEKTFVSTFLRVRRVQKTVGRAPRRGIKTISELISDIFLQDRSKAERLSLLVAFRTTTNLLQQQHLSTLLVLLSLEELPLEELLGDLLEGVFPSDSLFLTQHELPDEVPDLPDGARGVAVEPDVL